MEYLKALAVLVLVVASLLHAYRDFKGSLPVRFRKRTRNARPDELGAPPKREPEPEQITLKSIRDDQGTQYLGVNREPNGGLKITGHDLGSGVSEFWGSWSEYEYEYRIEPGDIAALVTALGGRPGDDPIELLQASFTDPTARLSPILGSGGPVPAAFWSRVGD
jgi:hypothetical protein